MKKKNLLSMRTLQQIAILFLSLIIIFSSCKKEEEIVVQEIPIEETVFIKAGQQFANFQNNFNRIIHYSLTEALLNPYLYDLQDNQAVTRGDCPDSAISTEQPQGSPGSQLNAKTLTLTFNNCEFTNTDAPGNPVDIINGEVVIYTFNSINQEAFLTFDEITINGFKIEFIPSDPIDSDYIKFIGSGATFYNAFIGGVIPPGGTVFDRSKFICTDLSNDDRMEIYPTYSGGIAFTLDNQDPFVTIDSSGTTNGTDVYNSIINNTYEIGINQMFTRFFLGTNTTTVPDEDYLVIPFGAPIEFKPLCKWINKGRLEFFDLTTSQANASMTNGFYNIHDMSNDPCRILDYGAGATAGANGECDNLVELCECDLSNNTPINCNTVTCY